MTRGIQRKARDQVDAFWLAVGLVALIKAKAREERAIRESIGMINDLHCEKPKIALGASPEEDSVVVSARLGSVSSTVVVRPTQGGEWRYTVESAVKDGKNLRDVVESAKRDVSAAVERAACAANPGLLPVRVEQRARAQVREYLSVHGGKTSCLRDFCRPKRARCLAFAGAVALTLAAYLCCKKRRKKRGCSDGC